MRCFNTVGWIGDGPGTARQARQHTRQGRRERGGSVSRYQDREPGSHCVDGERNQVSVERRAVSALSKSRLLSLTVPVTDLPAGWLFAMQSIYEIMRAEHSAPTASAQVRPGCRRRSGAARAPANKQYFFRCQRVDNNIFFRRYAPTRPQYFGLCADPRHALK